MSFSFSKTGHHLFLSLFLLFPLFGQAQPCPTLNATAGFSSADCASGSMPCALCPGETFTLSASGQNLQPGGCVNWYYGTNDTFNPYNGEGTLLGCGAIQAPPPNP
ncbi:MAG: hypothetical protein IT260_15895, partial [Saprospiraceae bacterium]|nr:hypothetical protein [Saprospiraceae bacterium]